MSLEIEEKAEIVEEGKEAEYTGCQDERERDREAECSSTADALLLQTISCAPVVGLEMVVAKGHVSTRQKSRAVK